MVSTATSSIVAVNSPATRDGATKKFVFNGKLKMLGLFVAIVLVAVVPLGLLSINALSGFKDILLTFTLVATPLVTFFGFIWLEDLFTTIEPSLGVFRTAITASVITEWFVLLALTIFLADQTAQSGLQQQLVNSFTTIVGVVIAFYFGSQAYTQGKKIEKGKI